MTVKTILLATASSLVIIASATAADLPVRKTAPYSEVGPIPLWAGFYIGGTVGAARSDFNFQQENGPQLTNDGQLWSGNKTGAIYGGHIGFNWQADSFVYGVEADYSGLSVKRSASLPEGPNLISSFTASSQIDWLATFRGRAGLAVGGTMIYLTGGAAVAGVKNGWTGDKGDYVAFASSNTKVGWVAGAGFERLIGRNWSVRGEVLHADLGRVTANATTAGTTYSASFSNKLLIGRVGLSYKW